MKMPILMLWMLFLCFCLLEKRREFERRRKLHYNEFEAVMRARQLMEQDEEENEDIEVDEPSPSDK